MAFFSNSTSIKIIIDSKNKNYSADENFLYKLDNNQNPKQIVEYLKNDDKVVVPEGIENIDGYAFYLNKLKSIELPKTLTKIDAYAFRGCGFLNNVEIPESVSVIGDQTFSDCTALRSVKINKPKGSISGAPWGIPIGERAIMWTEN